MAFPFLKENTMKHLKQYGLIRNIDSAGRVVLPKEIRKQLKLSVADPVEISVVDQSILIEKYQPLQCLDTLCEQYLCALYKNTHISCAVCSTDHVLASRGIQFSTEMILSEKVQKHINTFEAYHYSEESPLSLFTDSKYVLDTLYPIGTKDAPLGAVILLHYRNVTPTERSCAQLTATLLTNQLINNHNGEK